MRTSRSLLVAVTAGALALGVLATAPGVAAGATRQASGAQPYAGVDGTVVWGASVTPSKTTPIKPLQTFQTKVGRTVAATRDFLSWDSAFPTTFESSLTAQGTTILLSVSTTRLNKTAISFGAIAAAQPGDQLYADMVSWADRVRGFGVPIYVTFQHEPEAAANKTKGTQADYIAAWRNWVSVFRAEGATNARFMFITTAFGYLVKASDHRYAPAYYPGDDVVDAIAVDAYNWFTCRATVKNPWNSLASLIAGQKAFGALHPTKPLWLAEYASVEDPNMIGRRAQWLTDAQNLFKQAGYEQYVGILYFDLKKQCDWRVENDTPSLNAFSAMGQDPFYSGTVS
jgi:hypothetical protein